MNYLNKYFDQDDIVDYDLEDKNQKDVEQMLENLGDISVCPHLDRVHRARFMCHSCYHGRGNLLKAWKCSHTDMPHHSSGMCKHCYHQQYYEKKLRVVKGKKKQKSSLKHKKSKVFK